MNAYYTHQKYLTAELEKLDYTKPVKVLEFGTGDGSASILHDFAKHYPNLTVESFETDFNWLRMMAEKYPSDNYRFYLVDFWGELFKTEPFKEVYALAFVDAGPDFDARIQIINYIKDKVKVIVLHDYDFYNKGIMDDHYFVGAGSFFGERYSKEFILQGNSEYPGTLVMKNKKWIGL